MAGIWERVKPSATDRVSSHLLDAAFVLNGTGTFTTQQVVDRLNAQLSTALSGQELTDLNAIASELAGTSGTANKLVYMEKIKSALICAELNAIDEAEFRGILGIS